MIDIHNHLLPSFDDGSPTLDDSLDMAEIAAASGIDTVILTPHCNIPRYFDNYYEPNLMLAFQNLQTAIQQAHIKVIKGIAHHVALIRRETQLVSGKTGTIQGQSGLHQRAVDIAAAAESQIHSENLLI